MTPIQCLDALALAADQARRPGRSRDDRLRFDPGEVARGASARAHGAAREAWWRAWACVRIPAANCRRDDNLGRRFDPYSRRAAILRGAARRRRQGSVTRCHRDAPAERALRCPSPGSRRAGRGPWRVRRSTEDAMEEMRHATRFRGCCCAARERAAGSSGDAREGPRHLADVDLAPGRGRGARARLRARRAGIRARHAPRDHRRQPAAAVLVDARRAGARRRPGADVPGRARRGLRLRAERRRDRVRDRRGPGAGRQDARGEAAGAHAAPHLLRRPARPAQLRGRHELRARCRRSAASSIARTPASSTPRSRKGRAGRRLGHALHVGHDRQAEGRAPDASRVHRRGARAAASSTG